MAVGSASIYDAGSLIGKHAVLWMSDAIAIDLNTWIDPASGWTLDEARGVSDTGWISGIGRYDPDGPGPQVSYPRLFVLQIPEPNAGLLTAIALAVRFESGAADVLD